jgi:hypothetical protein
MIDSQQASAALNDISEIVRRVRQSRIYNLASLIIIMWGVLVFVGNIASFLAPRFAGYAWLAVYGVGIACSFAISTFLNKRTGVRTFDIRALVALLLFIAFGMFCCALGHLTTPRQIGTFWAIYFMLVYTIAGLWVGYAFMVIGVGVTALTLIGYLFIGSWFEPWMAVVNGGGLIVGGLWMRRN